ncbi:MAG: ABC transporter permease, partial [Acidobacteriia bacterium]|nr:ABC transporter permease [Terriglobia bacterium]
QLARVSALLALRDFGSATSSRGTRRFRAGLIGVQIGLSVALLLAAGLLVASFEKLRADDLGFTPRGVLTVATSMAGAKLQGTAQVTASAQQLIDRLTSMPGVRSVAVTSALPTSFAGAVEVTLPPEVTRNSQFPHVGVEPRRITPRYFDVMQIPMLSGRAFTENDTSRSVQVAIINEAFVRKHFGGANPVGSHVVIGQTSGQDFSDQPREIVGVAADTRGERRMEDEALPCIYVPMAQLPDRTMTYRNSSWSWSWVVRTEGDPQALSHQIQEEMRKAAPAWVIENPKPMSVILGAGIEKQKLQAMLLAAFAGIALLLAAVGLYGTMSQTLAERRHELGVRSALGATSGDLVFLMMRYSLKLVAVGLIIGLAAAAGFHRLIAAYLFGVKPADPSVYAVALVLLILTALAAALVPALRARKVNPRILLQQ